jgi:hypothetical protein
LSSRKKLSSSSIKSVGEDGGSATAAGVLQAGWAYPRVQSIARGDELRSIMPV